MVHAVHAECLRTFTRWVGRIAAKVNYWISYFFVFEYILRVLWRQAAGRLISSRMGILDFIVCVPFLGMFFGLDWQILYSLRLSACWPSSSMPGLTKLRPVLKRPFT